MCDFVIIGVKNTLTLNKGTSKLSGNMQLFPCIRTRKNSISQVPEVLCICSPTRNLPFEEII